MMKCLFIPKEPSDPFFGELPEKHRHSFVEFAKHAHQVVDVDFSTYVRSVEKSTYRHVGCINRKNNETVLEVFEEQ